MTISKGDAKPFGFAIKLADETVVTPDNCEDVEIAIGSIIKSYANETVSFSSNKWVFQLTQEESFAIKSKTVKVQVRVKFSDLSVTKYDLDDWDVLDTTSKEVL